MSWLYGRPKGIRFCRPAGGCSRDPFVVSDQLAAPWNVQRWVGSVLVVVGVAFGGVARCQLGKSFSIRPKARELVAHGLYSKIRNPIYVFGSMIILGLILVLEKPVLWVGLAAVVAIQTIRARREARVLEQAFGDSYREYRRKTWF